MLPETVHGSTMTSSWAGSAAGASAIGLRRRRQTQVTATAWGCQRRAWLENEKADKEHNALSHMTSDPTTAIMGIT